MADTTTTVKNTAVKGKLAPVKASKVKATPVAKGTAVKVAPKVDPAPKRANRGRPGTLERFVTAIDACADFVTVTFGPSGDVLSKNANTAYVTALNFAENARQLGFDVLALYREGDGTAVDILGGKA
jgi:hypothetical protein